MLAEGYRAQVTVAGNALNPGERSAGQEAEHLGPRQRRPIHQAQPHCLLARAAFSGPAQLARRQAIAGTEQSIEAPNTAEAAGESDLDDGQASLGKELLGQE